MSSDDVIKRSLFTFLGSHLPDLTEDAIDEIILSYVVGMLEDLSDDFDCDELKETLSAYLPEVEQIEHQHIRQWVQQVEKEINSSKQNDTKFTLDLKSMIEESLTVPKSTSKPRPKVNGVNDPDELGDPKQNRRRIAKISETSDGAGSEGSLEGEELQHTVTQLLEMFPYACSLEVNHCLQLVAGDVERAAQLIMHRHEAGQSLKPLAKKPIKLNRFDYGEKEIKERILGKYGFVDQEEDGRYHRPTIKTAEDKKMIRYRDGKIVSTKGERFTQVSKEESEEMKKAIVNIYPSFN